MKILMTAALAGLLSVSAIPGAISGPNVGYHSGLEASRMVPVELAHYRGNYYHHHRHYHHRHYHHRYAWGPRIFSVANEWRCNPLYDTGCFYPGPYVEFPQFYQ
ncbi:hypothetical protein [Methylocapsa palsarum]|uniref:Uncharacterized protein n=1 Tax=Methylocapsa palsarum TaxID=1612308 RepID=A0A1I4AFD7_9HYPH|nr:hypothetical protein [Methylocapsa palsarum]SFK55152.1 hypothetical protein SAMN05444581_11067 [Methylocapsa palsarum]